MTIHQTIEQSDTAVYTAGVTLPGILLMPPQAHGIIIFAHGSGSSRLSPRNRFVADQLAESGMATLLFDLLTAEESELDEEMLEFRFNSEFLSKRLTGAIDWLASYPPTEELAFGLFGASTGAAAALITAADRPERIQAVVSRGGRPDLAEGALERVHAPTLLIVGGLDGTVIDLNQMAARSLHCEHSIKIVPGATHLFEEPGKLDEVARLAGGWFSKHFPGRD